MKKRWAVFLALIGACGGSAGSDAGLDTPVDMYRGASTIVIHRPMSVGTRMHVQGLFRKHSRKTGLANGYVVWQDNQNLELVYDLSKTLAEVDLDGFPKRVRYDVGFVESSDADVPPLTAMAEGRAGRLQHTDLGKMFEGNVFRSGGQSFDFRRSDGNYKVDMLTGALNPLERSALTDPLGPGYEMWFEAQLAHLFGPKEPQREGNEWEIDLERAGDLLARVGELAPPMKVTGKATFVGTEKINDVLVQRIEATLVGEGGVKHAITAKMHANIHRVELKYVGLFPVDLSLPPVEHDWKLKGKGHMVIEIKDFLGDLHFELMAEHQARILEVRR
jgi:hypothetical protein